MKMGMNLLSVVCRPQVHKFFSVPVQSKTNFNLELQKSRDTSFFPSPLLFLLLDPGFGMDKNQDPGSTSRIRTTATQ